MAKVTYIEPRVNYFNHKKIKAFQKRKVAAYARVSTDSSEQLTSYAAQVDYYKKYILQHPEWEYAGDLCRRRNQRAEDERPHRVLKNDRGR